jgi:hypothetical protein
MAGFTDEREFDKFAQTLSLKGVGEKIKVFCLVMAGEDDQLSPIEYAYDLFETISAPKQLLVYEGGERGLVCSSAAAPGRSQTTNMADWLKDRLDGMPMQTKYMKVDAIGQIHESTIEEARKALSIPLQV